jgi:HK97 family phage portal protein
MLRGLGPVEATRVSVTGMIEGERLATDGYFNGGVPDGVVSVPGKLTEGEADAIRAGWDRRHAGKRGVAFLTGGMSWSSTRMSNADMQFLESREFSIRDVARMFRIPAALLNAVADGGGITYRNLEGVWTEYTRTAIEPIAERLEEAFSFLIPSTREIRHDYNRLLRADVQTRFNTYAIARQNGILTTNEIRAAEGLDPLDGGDRLDFRAPDDAATGTNEPKITEVDVDGI